MDYRLNPDHEKFRNEFVAWLLATFPEDRDGDSCLYVKDLTTEKAGNAYKEFQKRLFEAGYAGMHYPEKYGGQGKTLLEEAIVMQAIFGNRPELRYPAVVTHAIAAPTILTTGNEEQKKEFLPKILNGTHLWCQGFSEPGAGSDMANISTLAENNNGHYIVNGQKVWTSYAHIADYCILVVRTNPDVSKHKGLSYLLVDMTLPGIEVRPLKQITGEEEFNEVFFNNVKVPEEMLVGKEGQGWRIALTSLAFERVMGDVAWASMYERNNDILLEMAQKTKRSGKPVIEDPIFRQQLAQAHIEVQVLKWHGLRGLSHQISGGIPGPEGSIGKLLWSEPHQRISEMALAMQGPGSQVISGSARSTQEGFWQHQFLRAKGSTIEAGTSEIQRNIIGERVLGLPK
jgi:alkylation response protein AidB-like acyl-CoA dehydrogenase